VYEFNREERRFLIASLADLKKSMQEKIDKEEAVTDSDLYECRRAIGLCVRLQVRFSRPARRCGARAR
jgi:hypothetical protein